ncbi:hypothetical protein GCM10023222_16080 [Saccharopolyspora cebuensis]
MITGIFGHEFRYAWTPDEARDLVDAILYGEPEQFAQVYVWDRPCRQSEDGTVHEFPPGRLRITTDRENGWGALNYMHPGTPDGDLVDSFNPDTDESAPVLLFDDEGGLLFPRSASLPLDQVRGAIAEFCRTGARPTCVRWQPGEWF